MTHVPGDQARLCTPQLRVGQPPGSSQPLVTLTPEIMQPFDVLLYEARPGDPNVPQGKAYARLQAHDLGFIENGEQGAQKSPFPLRYAARPGSVPVCHATETVAAYYIETCLGLNLRTTSRLPDG